MKNKPLHFQLYIEDACSVRYAIEADLNIAPSHNQFQAVRDHYASLSYSYKRLSSEQRLEGKSLTP